MKIMLDECITKGPAVTISQFLAMENPLIEGAFVPDYFGQEGLKDNQWPDMLPEDEDWYVITSDRDKQKKSERKRIIDGPPLYKILPQKNITAVYLSGGIQRARSTEKVRAVISIWPQIKDFLSTSKPGDRALVSMNKGRFHLRTNY